MCRFLALLAAVTLSLADLRLGALATDAADEPPRCPAIEDSYAAPPTCNGMDGTWYPMSVAGRGTFCTSNPYVCVANQLGSCPGPQRGLALGSRCAMLASGVYGCVPRNSCDDDDHGDGLGGPATQYNSTRDTGSCERGCAIDPTVPEQCDQDGAQGWKRVSVVGYRGYCTQGPVCAGDQRAACPGPQRGLPFGSSCVRIPTGVFGCVANSACQASCGTGGADDGGHPLCEGETPEPSTDTSSPPAPATTTSASPSTSSPSPPPTPLSSPPPTSTPPPVPIMTTATPAPTTPAPAPASTSSSSDPPPSLLPVPVPGPDDTFTDFPIDGVDVGAGIKKDAAGRRRRRLLRNN